MNIDFLIFTEIIISILLVFIVLVQNKNVSLNLSTMSSWMTEITKRWPEKVLQNITIVLGVLFTLNSLALYLLA
jgi:protein translocase SecG subunit